MTESEKSRIRRRADAATRGEWYVNGFGNIIVGHAPNCKGSGGCDPDCAYTVAVMLDRPADAEFIAHAREDVPRLLDALDSMERVKDLYFERELALQNAIAWVLRLCQTQKESEYDHLIHVDIPGAFEEFGIAPLQQQYASFPPGVSDGGGMDEWQEGVD